VTNIVRTITDENRTQVRIATRTCSCCNRIARKSNINLLVRLERRTLLWRSNRGGGLFSLEKRCLKSIPNTAIEICGLRAYEATAIHRVWTNRNVSSDDASRVKLVCRLRNADFTTGNGRRALLTATVCTTGSSNRTEPAVLPHTTFVVGMALALVQRTLVRPPQNVPKTRTDDRRRRLATGRLRARRAHAFCCVTSSRVSVAPLRRVCFRPRGSFRTRKWLFRENRPPFNVAPSAFSFYSVISHAVHSPSTHERDRRASSARRRNTIFPPGGRLNTRVTRKTASALLADENRVLTRSVFNKPYCNCSLR